MKCPLKAREHSTSMGPLFAAKHTFNEGRVETAHDRNPTLMAVGIKIVFAGRKAWDRSR